MNNFIKRIGDIFAGQGKKSNIPKQDEELRALTKAAVCKAKAELREQCGTDELFGFALCTDDDVRTLYHAACTRQWVQEKEVDYPGIGFICVEWVHSGSELLFEDISKKVADLADQDYPSPADWANARDRRFEALVLALKDCREEGLFDKDTLLCVASTDPSDHLEALEMLAVDRLNSSIVANQFAEILDYSKYRNKS